MRETEISDPQVLRTLRWQVGLTRLGLLSERALRCFWPLVSVVMAALAALMFGLQDVLPLEVVWALTLAVILGGLAAFAYGVRRFHWPRPSEALARLDETLPGRPIAALLDEQVIGAGDEASRAVWEAHRRRMAQRAAGARAPSPDLNIAARDPYALRYVALLALVMAGLFGSVVRVGSIADMTPGAGSQLATGPSWEGWIEPPAYTGKPALYLPDLSEGTVEVPVGSLITVRLYGEVGKLTLSETVSGRTGEVPSAADPAQSFTVAKSGIVSISGPGGAEWTLRPTPDALPQVWLDGPVDRTADGEMQQPFAVSDDYGVVSGRAVLALDLDAVQRRYGYARAPEPRDEIVLDLPMTISGDRSGFAEVLVDNLSEHPWAGLPVTMVLTVEDAAGQTGATPLARIELPGRRFFDPLAAALIEERRELLWHIDNADRVGQVLRAVMYEPGELFKDPTTYLKLRVALRRMELTRELGAFTPEIRDEVAQALWDIAVGIEDGTLENALERLRQAQDRLAEAIRRGASDDEIAELMDELRRAMDNYMRQLAQQAPQDGDQQAQNQQNMQTMTADQLQSLLDRLEQLMREGRAAEAQQLLEQLRQMMENMQVAQGDGAGQAMSPGQQALNGLGETLRKQQGLNDETFGDLQDRFGQGQPSQGEAQGEQGEGGTEGQSSPDGQGPGGLADRQEALRRELDSQRQNLPGAGTPEGDAARDALDRAGRAMDRAEDALRSEDFAGALDSQSEAMEALREGMRDLSDRMAAEQSGQQGDDAQGMGDAADGPGQDPLGRRAGNAAQTGTQDSMLQGEDVYRRARELLDEIRRRSSDQERPQEELDYLRRLLDRF